MTANVGSLTMRHETVFNVFIQGKKLFQNASWYRHPFIDWMCLDQKARHNVFALINPTMQVQPNSTDFH